MLPLSAQPREENSRYKLARGYEESGDFKSASRVYKELYDLDPRANVYYDGVYRTYVALGAFAELLPIVEDRVRRTPNDLTVRTQHGETLHRIGRREEAVRAWEGAIELAPTDEYTFRIVAQSQIDNQLFDLAVGTYTRGRSELRDPAAFAEDLAQILGILGRYEEATHEYLRLLERDQGRLNFVMGGLGMFTSTPDGADVAIKVVREHYRIRSEYLPYLELLSWLYTERGDYDGAFEMAKEVDRVRNGRGSPIYGFADRALREGRYDAAMKALEYFQSTYPKSNPLWGSALLAYTRALEGRYHSLAGRSKDDAEKLIERYRTIAEENKGTTSAPEALLQAARLQAEDLDDPEEAIATINELRSLYPKFPSLPEASLLLGDLYLRTGDVARARELYDAGAERLQPGSDGERYRDLSALRSAELLFYTGNFKEALTRFNRLSENSASEVANDALGYLFLLQENVDKNDSALMRYAQGSLFLQQRNWKRGIEEMEKAVALGRGGTLSDEALLGKAHAEESLGEMEGAVKTLLDLVEKYPQGTVADRALFRAAEIIDTGIGDRTRAMELYTRLLTEYATSSYVDRARTRIRALRGDS